MGSAQFPDIPAYAENDPNFKKVRQRMNDGSETEVVYRKGAPGRSREEIAASRAAGRYISSFCFSAPLDHRTFDVARDIVCMRDEEVTLRDGVKIYADIYLPKNAGPVPLIVSWWFGGKRQSEGEFEWNAPSCPAGAVSEWAKFEAADPGFWCRNGYAVANVDPRGVGNSEGDVSMFGLTDGRDGCDFIEWAAAQDWCSGDVALFGCAGVAMTVWRIAAERPEHLRCIAVWEGTCDLYREYVTNGGIPTPYFAEGALVGIATNGYVEDLANMLAAHPFMDAYWASGVPRWENIDVPAYITAGWCASHVRGAFEGFRRIASEKKWIRTHRGAEWPDAYSPENLRDLLSFFDRYLRDVRNGWEFTPAVRLEVMDAYDFDMEPCRKETAFPIERTEYRKLYLDAASGRASETPVSAPSALVYDAADGGAVFDYEATEETELSGYMKLRLWVECRGHDNMDLFVWVKKYDENGHYVPILCAGEEYRGAPGWLRVKRRALDEELSTDFDPVQAQRAEEPMEPGQVYPVDVEIWPHSRVWHKGEHLRVEITGEFVRTSRNLDFLTRYVTDNGGGKHVLHTGGEYESYLQIPVIPPRYQGGGRIVR